MEEERSDGVLSRREFREWVRRHDLDAYCHGAAFERRDEQLNTLEKFQERLIGGFAVFSVIAASGVVLALIDLLVVHH